MSPVISPCLILSQTITVETCKPTKNVGEAAANPTLLNHSKDNLNLQLYPFHIILNIQNIEKKNTLLFWQSWQTKILITVLTVLLVMEKQIEIA